MSKEIASLPLKQAYQEFSSLILSLTDEQFLSPMDGWSSRDVVALLIGWNGLMIEASRTILAGQTPAYNSDAHNDYSHINAGFTTKFHSRSKSELLNQLKTSMEGLEAFIASLPDDELTNAHGVVHYRCEPATLTRIIASLAGDYRSHTRQIQEWFKTIKK